MITATQKGTAFLRKKAQSEGTASLDEVVLAAVAERGPIESDDLEDAIRVGDIAPALERLSRAGYIRGN
ncbi:hypothetical protein LCGC14_0864810 [marine sediment metagenome]|uniref:Uncharacterized protein n=1 Tax=marine sediment metagenome TaxID=412755 RepID=A0A0F9PBD4_9ZZZZ